ncbi:iron permease [Mycena leptocephala]|nr:iron permease [Mycena leptocephala]
MKRDFRFWGVFAAIMVSAFTSALDLTAVSTALPVITDELHGTQFVWVGSAYALSSTAFLPMSGGVAEVFGRRLVLCGAAPTMNFLIAGRTVQGLGAGGLTSLTQIVLSDLVPLRDRGAFNGLIGFLSSEHGLSPPSSARLGGVLADHGVWRWLFYLNIFTSAFAAILVVLFLRLKTPAGTVRENSVAWTGWNFIVIASSSAVIIALTWGGIQYPWSSSKVLVPLCLGCWDWPSFWSTRLNSPSTPSYVPHSLMSTTTGLSGYLQTFIASVVMIASICASPTASGNIIAGLTISRTKHYRPQLWLAWCLVMVSAGAHGCRIGILTTATYFPVLAPLPISENAHALAFFIFTRAFGQVWGVTIGATVLQNRLAQHLPKSFEGVFPQGTQIAYAVIPLIPTLPPDVAAATREAFASALGVMWQVMIGIGALGLVVSLAMKHMSLHSDTDEKWGVDENREGTPETL